MSKLLTVDNPFTGETAVSLPCHTLQEALSALAQAHAVQREWTRTTLKERLALTERFLAAWDERAGQTAEEVTRQMGKPLSQAQGEVKGARARMAFMLAAAEKALAPEHLPAAEGFELIITHEPVGVVLDIAAWNYPLLIAVNAVLPAVLAGNAVLIKHSARTPLCGLAFEECFRQAGAPEGLVKNLVLSHADTAALIQHPEIGFVSFTGSVRGGHEVYGETARRFITCTLELGGKDPAYVAPDAPFDFTVENLVDGAFYNAGQSCCGIERIYVHESLYDRFVDAYVELTRAYVLGDPMDDKTNLGPLAQPGAPAFLEGQVKDAVAKGGRLLLGGKPTQVGGKGRFFEPAVVADTNHSMALMMEESFGPVIGIAKVKSEDEAVGLMNDSPYGLTASVWTQDNATADRLRAVVRTGTFFQNRCDFLEPSLPWVGVGDSGLGCSLSHYGFKQMTRLKSHHLRRKLPG